MRLVVFCNKARELTRMRTGVDDKSTEAGAKQSPEVYANAVFMTGETETGTKCLKR